MLYFFSYCLLLILNSFVLYVYVQIVCTTYTRVPSVMGYNLIWNMCLSEFVTAIDKMWNKQGRMSFIHENISTTSYVSRTSTSYMAQESRIWCSVTACCQCMCVLCVCVNTTDIGNSANGLFIYVYTVNTITFDVLLQIDQFSSFLALLSSCSLTLSFNFSHSDAHTAHTASHHIHRIPWKRS